MILALDTATTVGWAHGAAGSTPQFGARSFADPAGNGAVLGKFRHWLNQRCYELKPKIIAFEAPYIPVARKPNFKRAADGAFVPPVGGPPPMNVTTIFRLAGFVNFIEATAWELGIECRSATTTEITKFFTGRGNHGGRDAKKSAVIKMCRLYGWDVDGSDDAADALALWAFAESIVDPAAAHRRGQRLSLRNDPLFSAAGLASGDAPQIESASRLATATRSKPADEDPSNGRTEGYYLSKSGNQPVSRN